MRVLILILLTLALSSVAAPLAYSTGRYDEWGYHYPDEDVCADMGGIDPGGTWVVVGEEVDDQGFPWYVMRIQCRDGEVYVVVPGIAYGGEYVPGPPPAAPEDPWQQDYCVEPPERTKRL